LHHVLLLYVVILLRYNDMSHFRLIPIRHFFRRSFLTSTIASYDFMETIQQKAKLADERIQQLKSLIANMNTSKSILFSCIL
jgi:hypothetical protein